MLGYSLCCLLEGDSSLVRHRCCRCIRSTPRPVIVTISNSKDYIRVLLYSYYSNTTNTGWGLLLTDAGVAAGAEGDQKDWEEQPPVCCGPGCSEAARHAVPLK